jgi:hypothetical protein
MIASKDDSSCVPYGWPIAGRAWFGGRTTNVKDLRTTYLAAPLKGM